MPELAGTAVAALDTVDARTAAPRVLPIEARGIVLRRAGRTILDDVHVRIASHGITALMGPNGAGKSMLLRVLAALVTPDAGQVNWSGAAPRRALRRALGFVFQKPVLLRRSALANIRYALRAAGHGRAQSLARGREALAFAGLTHLARSPARLLSGGEQQRLAIARALALEPEAIFLDEPTSNLDPASTAHIEKLIREVTAAGRKVVLVTHDIGQAHRLADEITFMHHGRIVENTPAATFFDTPASDAARAFLTGQIVL
jgi:tungstate transport system ATP-binding protein